MIDFKVCAYGKFKPYAEHCTAIATRDRRGYALCETCYQAAVRAEIESDEFAELYYSHRTIYMRG